MGYPRIGEEMVLPSDVGPLETTIFDALGLTQGERDAVYEAVINLVAVGLEKARRM